MESIRGEYPRLPKGEKFIYGCRSNKFNLLLELEKKENLKGLKRMFAAVRVNVN